MERSTRSRVIVINQLLPHFHECNINELKECIFAEFDCKNESQFLSKALLSMYKSLTDESIENIKNKAIAIAEKQKMIFNNSNDSVANNVNNQSISILKYIQQSYKDHLSRLHSDLIDEIGSYLNKKESIELGYLNKPLYIETQKRSYLLRRCNDGPFIVTNSMVSSILKSNDQNINAFSYSLPNELNSKVDSLLDSTDKHQILAIDSFYQSKYFRNLFLRLNTFSTSEITTLKYIPIDLFFNNKSNFYNNNESRQYIEAFDIYGCIVPKNLSCSQQSIQQFCNNVLNHKQNGLSIRKLKHLAISIDDRDPNLSARIHDYFYNSEATLPNRKVKQFKQSYQRICNQLLFTLLDVCEIQNVTLKMCTILMDNMQQLELLFCQNLESITISTYCQFVFSDYITKLLTSKPTEHEENNKSNKRNKTKNIKNNQNNKNNKSGKIDVNGMSNNCSLTSLNIHMFDSSDMDSLIESISIFKQFFKNVQFYRLFCDHRHMQISLLRSFGIPLWRFTDKQLHGLNVLLLQNCDKTPLLKYTEFYVWDNNELHCLSLLFLYFIDNVEKLFLKRKTYLKQFKYYEITINIRKEEICKSKDNFDVLSSMQAHNEEVHEIFSQKKNARYDVNSNQIEIYLENDQDFTVQFGIIYQNIIDWFRRAVNYQIRKTKTFTGSIKSIKIFVPNTKKN